VKIDEELTLLEDFFPRLKVKRSTIAEAPTAPVDTESRFNGQNPAPLENSHLTSPSVIV